MDRKKRIHLIFRGIVYISAIIMFVISANKVDLFNSQNLIMFIIFVPACVLIGNLVISLKDSGEIDLSDAITAFVFIQLGTRAVIFFTAIYAVLVMFIREKYITKRNDNSKMFFNIAMYIISSHSAAAFIRLLLKDMEINSFMGHALYSMGYIANFIILNIIMIKIDSELEGDSKFTLYRENIQLLIINFIISSFVAITLCQINSTSGMTGTLLVLGNLIILHYCFHILRKMKIRNEAIKGLLKITEDIVKYGEFREKCTHLITNMKNLIPYTICAIYTFDVDNDGVTYPIAYDGPEGMGIGDLSIDLSSSGLTINTIKEGKMYISKDISKDKKIKFSGKFANAINVVIIIPVIIGEKVVGSIFICGKRNLISFTAYGIDDLLHILSNQMALAIENDGIYRDMKNKADIDPLTKLYNRRVLDRELEGLISTNTPFSLVIYDLDDFKKVNDKYGHLAGDEVLKMVSEIVRKSIRKTDVPCRYGGEEIIIIFKDLSKEDACVISERIRNNIEITSTLWSGGNIFVTVSGGVSAYPQDGRSKNEIIEIADDILYTQCKKMGKNKVCAYQGLEESAMSIDHT